MGSIFVINEKVPSLRSCHTAGVASQAAAVGLVATSRFHDEWSARYDRLRGMTGTTWYNSIKLQ